MPVFDDILIQTRSYCNGQVTGRLFFLKVIWSDHSLSSRRMRRQRIARLYKKEDSDTGTS